jgi:hypothetical protein
MKESKLYKTKKKNHYSIFILYILILMEKFQKILHLGNARFNKKTF